VLISDVYSVVDVKIVGGTVIFGMGPVSCEEGVGFGARFEVGIGGFSNGRGSGPFWAGLGNTTGDLLSGQGGEVNRLPNVKPMRLLLTLGRNTGRRERGSCPLNRYRDLIKRG
jgi:hypothetical protein